MAHGPGRARHPMLLGRPLSDRSNPPSPPQPQAASVRRSDFQKVEFLLRHGRKQLKYLTMPGVGGASSMAAPRPSSSGAVVAASSSSPPPTASSSASRG